ncbi:MAG: Re/Si-specific NAD(P)(+) transhydrogenase subunit alpha [Candidatus Eisenbacteria bacterium]
MIVSVPRETAPGEARVALVPELVGKLAKAGATVVVEAGAGTRAGFPDGAYRDAGASVEIDPRAAWGGDAVLKVQEPRDDEVERLKDGATLLGLLRPAERPQLLERYAARHVTAFALERVPRTSRAQKMDALSAMSTIAGYKAVLLAAARLPRFFPLLMTAAGTIPPARVLILGAGVAGLSAIATARRLGAVVEAYDIRPAVREEVQSLGATFVGPEDGPAPVASAAGAGGSGAYAGELTDEVKRRVQDLLATHVAAADVVITTALVPGRRAPLLVPEAVVRRMKPGAVIVDLAAEAGGNCALTRPGEEADVDGVTILGPLNLPATVPGDASRMYARTITALFLHLVKDGALVPDFADDIVAQSCIARPAGLPA